MTESTTISWKADYVDLGALVEKFSSVIEIIVKCIEIRTKIAH